MIINDLKGILTSRVHLRYDYSGEFETELHGALTIPEIIEQGYGDSKIKEIFHIRDCLYVILEQYTI